jgi:AhpD family alkylhydroperoxidase
MERMNAANVAPGVYHAMLGLESYVRQSGLPHEILALVKVRASHMNGCAYCVDMHTKDARAAGETEQRLYSVPVWRETAFYTPKERAALSWTEAVTDVARTHIPDDAWEEVRRHFSEKEVADLTLAIVSINGWNRLTIAARTEPGSYQVRKTAA